MRYYALIKDGIVNNVILAEESFIPFIRGYDEIVESDVAAVGDLFVDGEIVKPEPVDPEPATDEVTLTRLSFLRRFTMQERIILKNSGDPIVEDALLMLQMAEDTALTDPDTIASVLYMRDEGYITPERADEILSISS